MPCDYTKYKLITVTTPTYLKLKELGQTSETFNTVIERLIEKAEQKEQDIDK